MDRSRYEGYVAARDAISAEPLDSFPAKVLCDLAEALLLARNPAEAEEAREHVPDALSVLVERGQLTRPAAGRLWMRLRACGPTMDWPPSWDRGRAGPAAWALRGH